jgi:CBS domain-containing protein
MQVSDAMTNDVKIASPSQTIRDAARLMAQLDVGALPVGENDRLVGMITDRDIARQ